MNIKKVAVLGAGAVGSYVIWGLSNNKNITLGVVADGERNERLKNQGLMINGTKYTPQVWTPEEAHNVDLLIVSLKYGSLRGALKDIQTIVGENTTVMSLMNGVDSEEIIAEKIDKSHILYSFIKVASQKKEDGYHFDPETTVGIYFGELQQPYESERVKAVNDIFENTGLHWIITALKEVMHLHLSYFPVIVIFGLGVLAGITLVIKLIRRALENHRSAMIYFVIGMMIGSLYAIVMGPTTLENTKAAMTLHTFHPVFFIIGIVIVFGLEKIKAIAE